MLFSFLLLQVFLQIAYFTLDVVQFFMELPVLPDVDVMVLLGTLDLAFSRHLLPSLLSRLISIFVHLFVFIGLVNQLLALQIFL